MRIFIFSRKFLVILLSVWVLHMVYFASEFWDLYGEDIKGKGVPASFTSSLVWNSLKSHAFANSFLAAFLLATAYCFHQLKKKGDYYHPFSIKNIVAVLSIAIMGFIFVSYIEPQSKVRSRQLLTAVVYARPGEKPVIVDEALPKHVNMMTLPELLKERKAIALRKKSDINSLEYRFKFPGSVFKWVDWEIGKKIVYPLFILLFYIMGVFLGISLSRTYAIWVLLIGYIVLFTGWTFLYYFLAELYRLGRVGIITGTGGPVILLLLLCITWYLIIRKQGLLKDEKKIALDELLTRENSEHTV